MLIVRTAVLRLFGNRCIAAFIENGGRFEGVEVAKDEVATHSMGEGCASWRCWTRLSNPEHVELILKSADLSPNQVLQIVPDLLGAKSAAVSEPKYAKCALRISQQLHCGLAEHVGCIEFNRVGNILTREALPMKDLRLGVGCDLGTSKALVALVKTPGSNVWKFRVIRWTAEESRESLIPKRVEMSNSQGLPTRGARPGRVQLTAPSGRSRASPASEAMLFIETYTILTQEQPLLESRGSAMLVDKSIALRPKKRKTLTLKPLNEKSATIGNAGSPRDEAVSHIPSQISKQTRDVEDTTRWLGVAEWKAGAKLGKMVLLMEKLVPGVGIWVNPYDPDIEDGASLITGTSPRSFVGRTATDISQAKTASIWIPRPLSCCISEARLLRFPICNKLSCAIERREAEQVRTKRTLYVENLVATFPIRDVIVRTSPEASGKDMIRSLRIG
ncbi:uncharacterized protein EI90DRAFT_3012856 [Cantharellus anzutake]|uniref:uncharacterized protein n=1 Tax=Cantharellus anzutake TaxID=1750568 RepID=UPI00190306FC|nr:uncharacterized protein EI90DRAFT_3012856 [Cantharellus anzutake]KAF8339954.1 hypothetical protein EI90DRAFT_3012856 [Cantharellus anzutake]